MSDIQRIDKSDINFDNIAAWLCGDILSSEQEKDVLKYKAEHDISTLRRMGIRDEFMTLRLKRINL